MVYIPHLLSLLLVIYLWKNGELALSLLFLVSFVSMYQQFYLVDFVASIDERTEDMGECLMSKMDYYSCMSIFDRISIHAAQVGWILALIATLLLARKMVSRR